MGGLGSKLVEYVLRHYCASRGDTRPARCGEHRLTPEDGVSAYWLLSRKSCHRAKSATGALPPQMEVSFLGTSAGHHSPESVYPLKIVQSCVETSW